MRQQDKMKKVPDVNVSVSDFQEPEETGLSLNKLNIKRGKRRPPPMFIVVSSRKRPKNRK